MAPSVPIHVETSNNKSGFGSIQVNAPIIGGTLATETERTRVRNELLAKIGLPNAEPRPARGTCEWILNDEKFQSWRASSESHLLWVSGRPGKGKSHLAAFLGEHLSHPTTESSRSPLVVKFSCDNTDARRSTSLAVHLNVLHQILQFHRSDETLHEKAASILNDVHTTLNSNLPREDLWAIIKEFINTTDHLTYLILDGLDECDAKSIVDLSEKLQQLCSTTYRQGRPHFKAILLSRPLATISNRDLWIDLDDDEQYGARILHEIRLFIDDKMGLSPIFETRKHELEILKTTLVERSNKTFLWVSLALELLKSHPSDLKAIVEGQGQDVLDRLLPVGLPSMYNRMLLEALRGKYDGQRNFNPEACAKIIQFVCVAFRPLTLAELQGAVDLSLEASAIIGYCKHILVQSSDETIYERTEEQFEDTDDESDGEPNEKTFQLVHLSLKEYLQQPRRFTFPSPLGLLLLPYLSSTVDTMRTATHSFYYLDHILFVAIFLSLNGVFQTHPVAGFILVALFVRGLRIRWMQERSWILQMVLRVFERLLDHCVFGIFAASERSCHRDLFLRSLALLMDERSGLQKETMENIQEKGALSAKKPKSVDTELAPFGRYACRFWVDHLHFLYEVDWTSREGMLCEKLVLKFLHDHFLDWLRSLSLQNNLTGGALSLRRLTRVFKNVQNENGGLESFLEDAERFMMRFVPIIERAPFQVYGSALAFCPNNSIVRSTFWDRVLPFAKKIKSPDDNWTPIMQVLEGHDTNVTSVAFSKDGKLVASTSRSDKIYLWETETGRLERVLRIEDGELECTAFSPRGQLIASGWDRSANKWEGTIWVWDEQTGALVRSIEASLDPYVITCSLDGDVLAAADWTTIKLWHLETGTVLRDIPIMGARDIYSIAFSPDGYLIASMSNRISVWSVETGQLTFTIVGDDFPINEHWHPGQEARLDSLVFLADGSVTVSGSRDDTLQLWDPETGKPSKALLKHRRATTTVAFSPDGTMVASGYGTNIHLWDSTSSSLLSKQLLGPGNPYSGVVSMTISPDKKILAAFSTDYTMNIWNLKAGTLAPLGARIPNVSAFAFSPRCDVLAFTSFKDDLTVRFWSVTEGKEAHVPDQLVGKVIQLCFSSDGNTLAVLLDCCVRLLDPATGTTQQVLESPAGSRLRLCHQNGPLKWLLLSPKTESVAFPTGQREEEAIEIWDPESARGSCVHLEDSTGHIFRTSFSPDGTKIAVSYMGDDIIRVWDTATGRLYAKIEGTCRWRTAMDFSPDNSLLMLSGPSSPVEIRNLEGGTFTETVQVTKGFQGLALSDCGNYLTTDRGVMEIGNNCSHRGFYVDGEWIVRGQERVLWLPPGMRSRKAILVNDLLVLGCDSGRVELVQFFNIGISILPVIKSDLPILAEFVHSSKLGLTINRLLYLDWPNDAAQKPLYRRAVESSFNNDTVQCLKAVDEESNELVGYLVLTPKTPAEARKDTEIGSDIEEQGVPEGVHAGVWSAVNNAAAEINRETDSLDHLELTYIYVKPSRRQKGIGSLLLQEAFRRAHADRVPLALCSEPAAYSFYKNHGFQDTKHVDIDLRLWAPPFTGFGIFRLSGMIRGVEGEMSGTVLQS